MALHQHFSPARTTAIAVCASLGIIAERQYELLPAWHEEKLLVPRSSHNISAR